MKKIVVVVFALIAVTGLVACGGSSTGSSGGTGVAMKGLATCTAVTGDSVVCGTVTTADGVTPIVGATLTRSTASGNIVAMQGLYSDGEGGFLKGVPSDTSCTTDAAGGFACYGSLTTGTYTFYITSTFGSANFSQAVTTDTTTAVDASKTTVTGSESTIKWLVVPGSFDGVQLLLSQLKGCTLTGDEADPASMRGSDACEAVHLYVVDDIEIAETFSALANLTAYDSIFVNCSTDMSLYATVLQEYVAQGGNLYFSDLSDEGITTAFPGNVTFGTSSTSSSADPLALNVAYSGLQTYLGATTVNVYFNLPVWQSILSVESNVDVYIRGDISSLVSEDPTSYTDAPVTVGWKEGTGGCVFYTSYHIEGASSGSAQEKALKYLVLNIDTVCQ